MVFIFLMVLLVCDVIRFAQTSFHLNQPFIIYLAPNMRVHQVISDLSAQGQFWNRRFRFANTLAFGIFCGFNTWLVLPKALLQGGHACPLFYFRPSHLPILRKHEKCPGFGHNARIRAVG